MSDGIPFCDDGSLPRVTGMYVAYVNHMLVRTHAGREILYFDAETKKWGYPLSSANYRGHIYGWIGPLPAMKLDLSEEGKVVG